MFGELVILVSAWTLHLQLVATCSLTSNLKTSVLVHTCKVNLFNYKISNCYTQAGFDIICIRDQPHLLTKSAYSPISRLPVIG